MSGNLPIWLERWLGVPAGSGEGTLWRLESTWGWAPWITLLFGLFAVGWVTYFYAREGSAAGRLYKSLLVSLRLVLIGLVALMIAELMISLRRTGLPTIAVMIDDSLSMGHEDRYDDEKFRASLAKRLDQSGLKQLTRLNLAKSVLLNNDSDLLAEIERHYKLKMYFVSNSARAQSGTPAELRTQIEKLEPTGESTRLGAGLRTVLSDLRGTPPAAVIILTDGITTEGESLSEAARYAWRKHVPLFAVGLGSDQPVRDLELTDLLVDEAVFVDDIVDFKFKLTASGLEGRSVDVVLREKDSPAVLAQLKITAGADGQPQQLHLPYRPTKVGEYTYVVEVEPLKEEVNVENNRQQRLVSVRQAVIRVLMVQAYPNFEYRYLKNMLERDSTIRLKCVLQDADLEYAEQDKSALRVFPHRREELFQYDVIVFGDVNPTFLNSGAMNNIAEFVEKKGGGVVFIAGQLYMPLAYRNTPLTELIPVDIASAAVPHADKPIAEGYKVHPTDLGMTSPQMQLGDTPAETANIWENLPELYWQLEAAPKPAAQVLAEHPTRLAAGGRKMPIFAMQYVGAGKVLFHATDETWRWRFRVGDVFFARYWVQAIRYLSRAKLLGSDRSAVLSADRREYRRGEQVRVRVRFLDERMAPAEDDGVTVVLEHAGHPKGRLKLQRQATSQGIFEGVLSGATDGPYHAWIATPTLEGTAPAADFFVVPPPGELEHVQMDAAELRRAAEVETRGHFYTMVNVSKLLGDLPPGRQVPIESLPPKVLWNQWWLLATFLVLLVSEWILRKLKGML